jgi:hypothetical protein
MFAANADSPPANLAIAFPLAPERSHAPVTDADAPPAPEMNGQERVAFTVYVLTGAMIVAFLAATLLVWLLGTSP